MKITIFGSTPSKKNSKIMKKEIKNKKITQKMCDDLLSPIIKQISPKCIFCNNSTQVAHHMFHKSKSLTLRYNFKNLIPLCNGCHFKLHFDEGQWSGKLIMIKGLNWFKKLDKINQVKIKPDYEKIYKTLIKLK